jgi:squalene-hopene/tetraprenyl-beta-curcumene cyclase
MRIAEIQNITLEDIRAAQNPDGGWPYRKGGSWTEPTVYALLAHCAGGDAGLGTGRALEWIAAAQRADGGWPPRRSVEQSTWVTALVALLPPAMAGRERHARAVTWLQGQLAADATPMYRVREWLQRGKLPEEPEGGWCWFPGTAPWVTPTCLSILALEKHYWRQPTVELRERIDAARAFLMARRCADGGWNHGSARALGFNSNSYPETTGQALLALRGTDGARLEGGFAIGRRMLGECRSAAGAAWLRLGLLAHGQLPPDTPAVPSSGMGACHTLPDAALVYLAGAAEQGCNVFLE